MLLKRVGSTTVEEAAAALSVASMTARQHLTGLERDGLVDSTKVRRATGRPHYLYRLTPRGEELFPRRFDVVAKLLLQEVGRLLAEDIDGLEADEKRSLVIQRAADRLAEGLGGLGSGLSLAERVAAATAVLQGIGGFAEWNETEDGYEIRDYNCFFAHIEMEESNGCEWHQQLLTRLLDHPVVEDVFSKGSTQCCRYLVPADREARKSPTDA
jgi:predicted ArsR family transcriptional regulator